MKADIEGIFQFEEEQKKHKEDVAKLTQDIEKIREELEEALKKASIRNKNGSKKQNA